MTPTPVPIQAILTQTVDVNWVIALATVIATVVAFGGFLISQRQSRISNSAQQRAELEKQVAKEVEARIGNVLISLRGLEADAKKQLDSLSTDIEKRQNQLSVDIAAKEQALKNLSDKSAEQTTRIEDLLGRARALIPMLENAEVIPLQLYIQAATISDPTQKTGLLLRILEHPNADVKELDRAGDLAKEKINNTRLAEKLYKRAFEIDRDAFGPKAKYLGLMAFRPSERDKARKELDELANNFPNEFTAVNSLMNFYIRLKDYSGLIQIAKSLLEKSSLKSLIWRNIALSHMRLGGTHDEITAAFESAMKESSEAEYANAARLYVEYLMKQDQHDIAAQVIEKGIRYVPRDSSLHLLRGRLMTLQGEFKKAKQAYELVKEFGSQELKHIANNKILDLEVLEKMV